MTQQYCFYSRAFLFLCLDVQKNQDSNASVLFSASHAQTYLSTVNAFMVRSNLTENPSAAAAAVALEEGGTGAE